MATIDNNETIFDSSLTPAKITEIIVNKNKDSDQIKKIIQADNYFKLENEEIVKKSRAYFDKEGIAHENPNANNAKIKSSFLRELVTQKQDYGFSKSFVFRLSNETEDEVDLSKDEYGIAWKKLLDNLLYKKIRNVAGEAINHGIAWCYIWIDENGELQLKNVSAKFIYPEWKDLEHHQLDKLVYNYNVQVYDSITPTQKEFAEYWSDNERILFNVSEGYSEVGGTKDMLGNPINNHMTKGSGEDIEGVSWGKIPFIALKGTDDETTLLSFVKEQIDAYDMLDSKAIDGLIDDLDPLLVFKGISPDINGLVEAREIAKMTRTMSLDTDGDASFIQAQTNIEALLQEEQKLKHDIIKFGYGVDYEDARFGGNPNQLVIKSLYQNMDTYMNGLERHFQNFINDLKYFFDKWYELSGKGSFEECQKYNILIQLDRDMMINQSALIDDSVKLIGTGVSQRTQLEFNPVVQDVDLELERLKEDREEALKNAEMFDFPNNPEQKPIEQKPKEKKQKEVEK